MYCTYGREKTTDLALYAEIKQKYQKWIIHEKLRVATSEREGKLSNPRARPARAMHGEKLRNMIDMITETRARAPRALCSDFLPPRGTVSGYTYQQLDLIR